MRGIRMGLVAVSLGLLAGVGGCSNAGRPTVGRRVGDALDTAFDAVRTGASRTAQAGKYVVEGTRSGAVCVYDKLRGRGCDIEMEACDSCITDAVHAQLESDP